MAEAKKTIVTLEVAEYEMKRDFELEHAERLLNYPNNGGWKLPADSTFDFSPENGITAKRTSKTDTTAKQA